MSPPQGTKETASLYTLLCPTVTLSVLLPPIEPPESRGVDVKSYRWQKHCRSLYQTPIAA